jgi:signal transduction histidine kinase
MVNRTEARLTLPDVLSQCVANTSLECAFLAMARRSGKGLVVTIPACYPAQEGASRLITRSVREQVRDAIDAASTLLVIGRRRNGAQNGEQGGRKREATERCPEVLIAVPIRLDDGRVWGALAAVGPLAHPYGPAIQMMERLARQGGALLSASWLSDQPDKGRLARSQPDGQDTLPFGAPHDVLLHELQTPLSAANHALEALACGLAIDHATNEHRACQETDEAASQAWVRWWHGHVDHLLQTAQLGVQEAQSILCWYGQLRAATGGSSCPEMAPVAIRETIDRALMLLPHARPRACVEVAEDVPLVAADRMWLTQIFINLLDNAVKYAGPSDLVQVTAERSGSHRVLISVGAPGSGIPFEEQAKIFRPYVRGRAQRAPEGPEQVGMMLDGQCTGQGLGLGIVRHFVTAMGGDIRVESDGWSSTTFSLTLPVAPYADGPGNLLPMNSSLLDEAGGETPLSVAGGDRIAG